MVDPQTRKLAKQLVGLEERLKHLETVPQLAHSSIDDHGLPVYDQDGNLTAVVGKQPDGTWGAPPIAGPVPAAPRGVSATGGSGIIHVRWTGQLVGDVAAPLDFDTLEVLIDGDLAGAIPNRDGGSVTIEAEQGHRFVAARIRTLVPRHSATTSPFSVEVRAPAEILFEDTQERAEQLAEAIAAAEREIEAARERLSETRSELEQLDSRVEDVGRESAARVSAGPVPPVDAPLGSQWITPAGHLYVRVPCDEEVA